MVVEPTSLAHAGRSGLSICVPSLSYGWSIARLSERYGVDTAISVLAWVACGRRMSARLARELQIAGLLAGKNPAEDRPARCVRVHGPVPASGLADRGLRSRRTLPRRRGRRRPRSGTPTRLHHAAVQCARRGHLRAHMSDGQVDVRHQRHRLETPERVTRRFGVGGRYRRPATASARSVSLARSPPGRGASGRAMPFFVLADVLEGETRPRDEVSYGLRDEDLRRAGQDSCRGRGEERGRTRLERVLAPGVRSGPC